MEVCYIWAREEERGCRPVILTHKKRWQIEDVMSHKPWGVTAFSLLFLGLHGDGIDATASSGGRLVGEMVPKPTAVHQNELLSELVMNPETCITSLLGGFDSLENLL